MRHVKIPNYRKACRSFDPKIFIRLECGHYRENFTDNTFGDVIDTVPQNARVVSVSQRCPYDHVKIQEN